jgi:hypothetical protein
MDYTSLQEAEQEYNRKLEIDFVNMLKGRVRHPEPDESTRVRRSLAQLGTEVFQVFG